MTVVISLASHKGGTGKTFYTINLAAYLVNKGYRVGVIDLDLNAPSMQNYLDVKPTKTINDLFLNNAKLDEVVIDATHIIHDGDKEGSLYFLLASTDTSEITKIMHRSHEELLADLYILMRVVKNELPLKPWNFDYIIIDAPPGLSISSINSIAVCDVMIFLMRIVNADVHGTRQFLDKIHNSLGLKTILIANQIPSKPENREIVEQNIIDLINAQVLIPEYRKKVSYGGIMFLDEELLQIELDHAIASITDQNKPRPIHLLCGNNSIVKKIESKCNQCFSNIQSSLDTG